LRTADGNIPPRNDNLTFDVPYAQGPLRVPVSHLPGRRPVVMEPRVCDVSSAARTLGVTEAAQDLLGSKEAAPGPWEWLSVFDGCRMRRARDRARFLLHHNHPHSLTLSLPLLTIIKFLAWCGDITSDQTPWRPRQDPSCIHSAVIIQRLWRALTSSDIRTSCP
jgi:hypothetical protein